MPHALFGLPNWRSPSPPLSYRAAEEYSADWNDDYEYYDYDLYSPSGSVQQQSRNQLLGGVQTYDDSVLDDAYIAARHISPSGHNCRVQLSPSRRHRAEDQMYQPVSSVIPGAEIATAGAPGSPTHDLYDNDAPYIYTYSPALIIGSPANFLSPLVNDQDNDDYDRHNDHSHLRAAILDNRGTDLRFRDYDYQLEPRPLRRQTISPPSAAIRPYTPSTTTTTTYTSVGHPIPPTLSFAQIQQAATQAHGAEPGFYTSLDPSPTPSRAPSFIIYSRQPPSPPLDVPRLSQPGSSPPDSKKFRKSNGTFAGSTIPSVSFLDHAFAKGGRGPHIPLIPSPSPSVTRPSHRSVTASRSSASLPSWQNLTRMPPPASVFSSDPTATDSAVADNGENGDDEDETDQFPSWMEPLPPERSYSNGRYASSPYDYEHPTSWKQKRMSKMEKAERLRVLEGAFALSSSRQNQHASSAPGAEFSTRTGVSDPPKWGRGNGGWERGTVVFREQGRRTRIAARWLQFLCAWIAGVACFYAFLIIRPNPAAPVSKHWTTYVVYLDAILSSLLTLHFFFLRRWRPFRVLGKALVTCCGCCGRAKKPKSKGRKAARDKANPRTRGKARGFEYGGDDGDGNDEVKGDEGRGHHQPVHVNVVLDPRYLAPAHSASVPAATAGTMPTTLSHPPDALFTAKGDPIPPVPHPHAIFHSPSSLTSPPGVFSSSYSKSSPSRIPRAAQRTLATDRRTLTRLITLDAFFTIGWVVLFVFWLKVPMSSSCPPGKYGGWCNSYNVAKAAGCGLALVSAIAFWLDIQDVRELGRIRRASSSRV